MSNDNVSDNPSVVAARSLLQELFDGKRFHWNDPVKISHLVTLCRESDLPPDRFAEALDLRPSLIQRFMDGRTSTNRPWHDLATLVLQPAIKEIRESSPKSSRGTKGPRGTDWKVWSSVTSIARRIGELRQRSSKIRWAKYPGLVDKIIKCWSSLPEGTSFNAFCESVGVHFTTLRHVVDARLRELENAPKIRQESAKAQPVVKIAKNEQVPSPKVGPCDVLSSIPFSRLLLDPLHQVGVFVLPGHPKYRELLGEHFQK